jgi:hypothetical protein
MSYPRLLSGKRDHQHGYSLALWFRVAAASHFRRNKVEPITTASGVAGAAAAVNLLSTIFSFIKEEHLDKI